MKYLLRFGLIARKINEEQFKKLPRMSMNGIDFVQFTFEDCNGVKFGKWIEENEVEKVDD